MPTWSRVLLVVALVLAISPAVGAPRSGTCMGVRHPDTMSAIILAAFWRHLHKKPIRLEALIGRHRR